jgi:hypothetical protein
VGTKESKESLARAWWLFGQVDSERLIAGVEKFVEEMVVALRGSAHNDLNADAAEAMHAEFLKLDEMMREVSQRWSSPSGVSLVTNAVSQMQRQCEDAIRLVDEAAV